MKYDFWCFASDFCEVSEQIFDAVFVHVDIDFDVSIEKRDDFKAMIERETISTQNNCFLDVARSWDDCFDVADEVKEDELEESVSINVDSLDDEDVAIDVNIVITAFDVEKDVIDANIAIDVISVDSLDVNFANFAFDVERDVDIAIAFDVSFANFAFDVDFDVDVLVANSLDVAFANSFASSLTIFANFFWWWFCTCWWSLMLLENFAE